MSVETLNACIKEDRLIRNGWSGTDDRGRQLLCLYTALAGDPNARPETCTADLCDPWFAYLLSWIDDAGTKERWREFVRRVAVIATYMANLDPVVSRRLECGCRIDALRVAEPHDRAGVVQRAIALCDRVVAGDEPSEEEWTAANDAARAAARAARTVAWSSAWAASSAASSAARHAASDRIIDAMLTRMEKEFGITKGI